MSEEISYQDLQKEASALGIKAVGVSRNSLIQAIAEAKAKKSPEDKESTLGGSLAVDKEKEDDAKEDKKETTKAIVTNGTVEVRTYTLEEHGDDFKSLANQFAEKKGYTVVVE